MRDQRWESQIPFQFPEILSLYHRLADSGLSAAGPDQERICYIEEFGVEAPHDIHQLEEWPTEDVTMVHVFDDWEDDFYLLGGRYHTVFQHYQSVNAYCSVSHPWKLGGHFVTLHPLAMLWIGFRHTHSFIRVRLHTTEIVNPGDPWASDHMPIWIEERRQAFQTAIDILDLPIEISEESHTIQLRLFSMGMPFFCSWPDAFGPCQFEYNSSDPFEFLVPASRLVSSVKPSPSHIRIYLTGFSLNALRKFSTISSPTKTYYRCSAHCTLNDIPHLLRTLKNRGQFYLTLCEFQTKKFLPEGSDAVAIVGMVGRQGQLFLEVRLNMMPLSKHQMDDWLQEFFGYPMAYTPLSPFF